jgi:hypothetical protein
MNTGRHRGLEHHHACGIRSAATEKLRHSRQAPLLRSPHPRNEPFGELNAVDPCVQIPPFPDRHTRLPRASAKSVRQPR